MLPPHIHYACVDVLLCCLLTYIQGCQPWPGGLPLFCSCLLLCLGITAPCLPNLFILVSRVLNPLCHHNFQHWMSWLGWWWRVQQSVISMLNSRISWINRDLNAHCAFGVFLKACLLQRLSSYINELPWLSHAWLVHALCVTADMPLTHAVHSLTACHLHPIEDRCLVACMWLVPGLSFQCFASCICFRNMNLGQQARWI